MLKNGHLLKGVDNCTTLIDVDQHLDTGAIADSAIIGERPLSRTLWVCGAVEYLWWTHLYTLATIFVWQVWIVDRTLQLDVLARAVVGVTILDGFPLPLGLGKALVDKLFYIVGVEVHVVLATGVLMEVHVVVVVVRKDACIFYDTFSLNLSHVGSPFVGYTI